MARQPLGAGDQGDPGQDGDAAAGGGVEQALFGGVAHQEDAGEQQRRGAEPDAPAHGEQGLKVARRFGGRLTDGSAATGSGCDAGVGSVG